MTEKQGIGQMVEEYKPIACVLFDYIEMACLYEYKLLLILSDGSRTTGVAKNTKIVKDKGEFLQLCFDGKIIDIRLDLLSSIEPQDSGARFGRISFESVSQT